MYMYNAIMHSYALFYTLYVCTYTRVYNVVHVNGSGTSTHVHDQKGPIVYYEIMQLSAGELGVLGNTHSTQHCITGSTFAFMESLCFDVITTEFSKARFTVCCVGNITTQCGVVWTIMPISK